MKKRFILASLVALMLITPITTFTFTNNSVKVEAIRKPRKQYFPRKFWGKWKSKYRSIKINKYGVFSPDFGKHHHLIYRASDRINNDYNGKGIHSLHKIFWYPYEYGYTAYTPEGYQPIFFKFSRHRGKKVLLLQVAASQEIFHRI